MREIWHWSLLAAGCVAAFFLIVDGAFFLANLSKVAEGGYVPLILAISVYGVMWIWHRGAAAVSMRMHEALIPVADFIAKIAARNVPRVAGTAVFLTRTERDTPPVMVWHVKHNRALHEHLFVLRVEILSVPLGRFRQPAFDHRGRAEFLARRRAFSASWSVRISLSS